MKFLSSLNKKNLQGKICLLRVDLNIQNADLPSQIFQKTLEGERGLYKNRSGLTRNNFLHPRILAILPTINFLLKNGAKVVIMSHRGRPDEVKGKRLKVKEFSLKQFVNIFSKLLNKKVAFVELNNWTSDVQKIKSILRTSDVFMLENLRFLKGEKEGDLKLAKKLASLGDIYINDSFAVDHRNDASLVAITKYLPSYVGLLLEKEIRNLNEVMKNPKKPLVVILGGVKVSDKTGVIKNLQNKADYFLIGGGVANNFLKAQGFDIGNSVYEKDAMLLTKKLLNNKKIILPDDYVVENKKILDIGPYTVEKYSKIIKKAKTIIWAGPMGMVSAGYKKGSKGIVKAIFKSSAFVVIGGGETTTLSSLKPKTYNLKPNLFISTGGGAMSGYLSGKKLPGIEALKNKKFKRF